MAKTRLFVDSDIIIDLLAKRDHFAAAYELFSLIDQDQVEGTTTPIVLANVAYIIEKYSGRSKARKAVRTILDSITVLPVDGVMAKKAADSKFPDFEDAMQYYAAENEKIEIIVTRNKKHYNKGSITVMTADEFVTAHTATSSRPEV